MRSQPGFALIATISVMVLLVMIALAMLSLNTIELRTSRQGDATAEAQANARMALMIALGELQKHAGPDQRVTVPATQWDSDPSSEKIEGVKHPKLTAVYRARSMEDEMANTLPSDYYSRENNFLTWLVSHSDPSQRVNPAFAQSGSFSKEVVIAPHSDAKLALRADKVALGSGAYAWGVTDESMKYSLRERQKTQRAPGTAVADALARSGLPGSEGHKILKELEDLDKDGDDLEKVLTPDQFSLLTDITGNPDDVAEYLTPRSLSLLTDTKKGGFKDCLNMLLELEEANLPAAYGNMKSHSSRWGGSRTLNLRMLSDEEFTGSSNSITHDTLPVSMLWSYYHTARMGTGAINPNANDPTSIKLSAGRAHKQVVALTADNQADRYWKGYGHSIRLVPVIMRTRDVIYATAVKLSATKYELRFISFPIVTLWNPYNVDITMPYGWCRHRGHSLDAEVRAFGSGNRTIDVAGGSDYWFGQAAGSDPITFTPGETKVMFPDFQKSGTDFSGQTRFNFINEWPASLAYLKKFTDRKRTYVEGSATTSVNVSLIPSMSDLSGGYKTSHYYDGWISSNINGWRGTKFHNWDFDLRQYRSVLTGGENILTGKTLGSLYNTPWPVAILDVGIKSADHAEQPGLVWTFDYPHRMNVTPHYAAADEDMVGGRQASPMTYSFTPLRGETDLSKHLSVMDDAAGMHDIAGFSYNPSRGASYLTLCELPFVPLHSLGQLQHLPLQDSNWQHDSIHPRTPTWTFGIGNSWAHPWLSSSSLTENRSFALLAKGNETSVVKGYAPMTDRLWCANSLVWDSCTFTTMAPQNAPWFQSSGSSRDLEEVYDDFFSAYLPLPNDRLIPWPGTDTKKLQARLISSGTPTQNAHKILPANLALLGGINVNNTSVEVWKLLLASTLKLKIPTQSHLPGSSMKVTPTDKYFVSRFTQPTGPSIDGPGGDPYINGYHGYRELTKDQIDELAEAIVVEVKERGPFRSLAEFVNRQRTTSPSDAKTLYGALQAALESKSVSINNAYKGDTFRSSDFPDAQFTNRAAVDGLGSSGFPRARGIPGYVTQADLLVPLAPVITARGDTFTIHAYGESHDASGKVIARAHCKAVVQRCPEFIDPEDAPETILTDLQQGANKTFGRKFKIVSFQWVSEKSLQSS